MAKRWLGDEAVFRVEALNPPHPKGDVYAYVLTIRCGTIASVFSVIRQSASDDLQATLVTLWKLADVC